MLQYIEYDLEICSLWFPESIIDTTTLYVRAYGLISVHCII